jgi:lipopolysaccharide transport system ATP-binding protein
MSKPVIQVENLSKAYQIGQIGTGTISRDLERFFATKILGKEDPFLKIGETNDRSIKGQSDIVWSLKDINFEINQGDAVGIIGKNGAGKSTLLKLLSRVTSPTTGEIKVKGRIASLLEVGTGFHPELSGRENIYLNGAILGMRKKEIARKLDEIIDFSGVERYIDTPVKRYSSGMYVRLAFAVAAHLESEILIVDEVLAVGDAEFQKKCLGKMGDISKGEGRTVLFVSHNMAAVQNLCTKGILLENGIVSTQGDVDNVIRNYLETNKLSDFWIQNNKPISGVYISSANVIITGRQPNLKLIINTEIFINESTNKKAFLAFYISAIDSSPLMEAIPEYDIIDCSKPKTHKYIKTELELNGLIPGVYNLGIWIGIEHSVTLDWQREIIQFEIGESPILGRTVSFPKHAGFLIPNSKIIEIK